MTRLLAIALLLVLLGASPAAALSAAPVVVVGVSGLRWDDVDGRMPVLADLARRSAVGVLSVKALPDTTCRADGWLTLGAGARADAQVRREPCDDRLPGDPERLSALNAASRDRADLGALAQVLDGRVATSGDGARLAARLPPGAPDPPSPLLRLVDAGTVPAAGRDVALAAVDEAIARALEELPPGADLLVLGLSASPGQERPSLHVALATGPSFPPGALRSASTRRDGYVQLIDVAPTVLALLDRPAPEQMDGQPWQVAGPAPSVAELVDLDRKARAQRRAAVPFFVVLLGVPLALFVALWRRPRAAEVVALTGTAGLGASYVANLIPWWRAGPPLLALLAVVVPMALAVALVALRAPAIFAGWRPTHRAAPQDDEDRRHDTHRRTDVAGVAQLVCGVVALVLVADLVTGAHLQLSSVAGYSPLVAGRFAGLGNVAFGVLAASVLLAASALRRLPALVAVGFVAVVVDGAPPFGSDVGGVLALLPAFALLAMLRTGTRVTAARLVLATAAAVAVVTAFALADWSRAPADRSHLGRFVQDVADGAAGEVLGRKAGAVLSLLLASPVTALLPVVVAAAAYLVLRPPPPLQAAFDAAPAWRQGLLAVALASLLGFALNDSGPAVPALALCVAVPATAAVVARARRLSAKRRSPVA